MFDQESAQRCIFGTHNKRSNTLELRITSNLGGGLQGQFAIESKGTRLLGRRDLLQGAIMMVIWGDNNSSHN